MLVQKNDLFKRVKRDCLWDRISSMGTRGALKEFFFPRLTGWLLIRMLAVALAAYLFFSFIVIPIRLRGRSMEPAYSDGSLHFLFAQSYLFGEPEKSDVVGIRLSGRKIVLLKRIVARGPEKVSFRKGVLYVNGNPQDEPYLKTPCDWEYDEKEIRKGDVFVVGDNRSVPIEMHDFGEVSEKRIMGKLIW
jgi:signal peptidase I